MTISSSLLILSSWWWGPKLPHHFDREQSKNMPHDSLLVEWVASTCKVQRFTDKIHPKTEKSSFELKGGKAVFQLEVLRRHKTLAKRVWR
jgi:hypothetical protein